MLVLLDILLVFVIACFLVYELNLINLNKVVEPSKRMVESSKTRVLVIGVGAAEWKHILPLVKTGQLPNIARLMENGVYGDLLTKPEGITGPMWTTIATGKEEDKHGIDYQLYDQKTGRSATYTSNLRKTKAVWNILGENNYSVGVVGWVYTWPAEEVNGFMVAPYMTFRLGTEQQFLYHKEPRQLTSQPTVYANESLKQTYPQELYWQIEPFIIDAEDNIQERIKDFVDIPQGYGTNTWEKGKWEFIESSKWVLTSDEILSKSAIHLLKEYRPDFFAYYVTGLDPIIHRYHQPSTIREYGNIIERYWIYVDEIIGKLIKNIGEDTTVIVVSEHGVGMASDHMKQTYPGVIIMSGPNIKRGHIIWGSGQVDVTPTILYLMGLPVGEDMDGKVLEGAIENDFLKTNKIRYTPTYDSGTEGRSRPITSPFDDEIKERMWRIGYLDSKSDIISGYIQNKGGGEDYINWNENKFYAHMTSLDDRRDYCFHLQDNKEFNLTITLLESGNQRVDWSTLPWWIDLSVPWDDRDLQTPCVGDPWGCMIVRGKKIGKLPYTIKSSEISNENITGYTTIHVIDDRLCFHANKYQKRVENTSLGYTIEVGGYIEKAN